MTPTVPRHRLLHRYAVVLAAATFLLVIAGGLVTSTGSGLAVPDWPLSFGQVFPDMQGGVLFEHGHRLIAATVGLLTIGLVVLARRLEPRAGVRALAWTALGVVILQGVLGGATVLLRLPDAVSVAHAGLAQIFFALTVVIAGVTAPSFAAAAPPQRDARMRTLTIATAAAVYAQILLGAIVRHTGAGLAIPDYPLSFGRLVPAFSSVLVLWAFAHRWFAIVPAALIAWTAARLARRDATPQLVRPAAVLLALLGLQLFLGAATIWTRRAVIPTTAHVATGALIFATSVLLAVRAHVGTDAEVGVGRPAASAGGDKGRMTGSVSA